MKNKTNSFFFENEKNILRKQNEPILVLFSHKVIIFLLKTKQIMQGFQFDITKYILQHYL